MLKNLNDKKIFICYGLSNDLREKFCFRLIYKYFNDRYVRDLDVGVFKISSVSELDEIYLEDELQIFYFYDFPTLCTLYVCQPDLRHAGT